MESREKDILKVWEFWNDSKIIQHRDLSKFAPTINGRLNFYSCTELCQAIRNYKDIITSERHWFNYHWDLYQFLTRKNALDNFIDREVALNKFSRRKKTSFESEEIEDDSAEFYRAINKEAFGCPKVDK